MPENPLAPTYMYTPPREVEAMQWMPDDEETVKSILWWLIRRRASFRLTHSSPLPGDPILILDRKNDDLGSYVFPTDWIIRDGPGAWVMTDDESFQCNYK